MMCALTMAEGSLVIIVSSHKWLDVAAVVLTIISDSTCPGLRICPHPATGGDDPYGTWRSRQDERSLAPGFSIGRATTAQRLRPEEQVAGRREQGRTQNGHNDGHTRTCRLQRDISA